MGIELTEEQRQAVLDGKPVRLAIPELGKEVVLLGADAFEEIREILEDEWERRAIARVAVHNAAWRLLEEA